MRSAWLLFLVAVWRASSQTGRADTTAGGFHHSDKHSGGNGLKLKGNHSAEEKRRQGGTLPTIFTIGIQKGGSSSLYELMIEHPLLCPGLHKEVHYFDHPENYARGTNFYRQTFSDPKCDFKNGTHFIDGTPVLHYPSVWQRIHDTYADTVELRDNLKFIVLLREPVSRDYSWYQHTIRTDLHLGQVFSGVRTLNETFTSNSTFFRRGRYLEQLLAFTRVFKRNQLLVISSVEVFKNTPVVMERIRNFLGIPKDPSFLKPLPHDDHLGLMIKDGQAACITAHVPALDCWVRDAMGTYFESYNQALYSWLNKTREQADPSETRFWPEFDSYTANPCSNDSRAEYNKLILADSLKKPPQVGCFK